ncbi:MAG: spermidine/putrescine ABC transporter substrate-binding protein [Proteobacteria bacterium]|nr:spermidine/putrescine ABC transporter substrate-binding protein [Pseudomonadota bacterium]MBU1545454.1 spermidine/putrescine ABC transporter substrate-binding protein [Pseudomonadota bacterium]MBU2620492.1 spermidine/putrescine ABC transporter substrate-binding protein [Pseudomonadota bacterium]
MVRFFGSTRLPSAGCLLFFFALLWASLFISPPQGQAAPPPKKPQDLVFLNWPDYMDQGLIRKFEKLHGVKVRQVYYETEEEQERLLSLTNGKGYDVVLVSRINGLSYLNRKWLAPVDAAGVPNIRHIDPAWGRLSPEFMKHAVPFSWGTLGIVYRKDLVKGEVRGWKDLLAPQEELRGKILMIKDRRDAMVPALKMLGYSVNSTSMAELDAAERTMLAQKPFVKKYGYPALDKKSQLVKGDIWMAMVYSGDAVTLQELNKNIAFAFPEEGTSLWLDNLVVMNSSSKKNLAMAFINFLNEPENAAQLAEHIFLATPNLAAKKLLSPEHLRNTIIWPDEKAMLGSELYGPLPARVEKRYNSIFLKTSEGLR